MASAPPGSATTTSAEQAYLDLVARVLERGVRRPNRTGTDTLSLFGEFYRVDLAEGFPLLTTKRVNFNAMWREVLWYLSGEDHIRTLRRHTRIWDDWADENGELETAYGRFWRYYPLPEPGAHVGGEVWADITHPDVRRLASTRTLVFDQLGYVERMLRTDPYSRRLVVSAWHPANAAVSRLPPCHYTFCFNVSPDPEGGPPRLNCHLTQRSADIALGVPFNLACYALLTQVLAEGAGMQPGTFAHSLVDAHVYVNHIDGLQEQLRRTPYPLPQLHFAPCPSGRPRMLDELRFEDAELVGYEHHPAIRFPVAV
ncbi:MAG: thymidylate synthase [Rubricoccaceae bacterium]